MHPHEAKQLLRRTWLAVGISSVALAVVLSIVPSFPIDLPIKAEDKVVHVLGYAALMWWFSQVYIHIASRLVIALVLVSIGLTLEGVQWLEASRSLQSGDLIANAAGVTVGWVLAPPRLPNIMERLERRIA